MRPSRRLTRLVAALIDAVIIGVIRGIIFGADRGGFGAGLLGVIYFCTLTYYEGATFGKKLFKLKVVREDGKRLTLTDVIMREVLGKFVSGIVLGLGYVWILFDKKRQGWHDKIAHTLVVQGK